MNSEEILNRIKSFATEAHGAQMRKYTPEPYIVHPIRVMEICQKYTDDIAMLSAAILHDVLEDTKVTGKEMMVFLNSVMSTFEAARTMELVIELTDVYTKEDYPQFNRKKRKTLELKRMEKTSAGSQTIKYADIIDNAREIVTYDPAFGRTFLTECRALLRVIDKGHPELYSLAQRAVNEKLALLNGKRG